METGVMTNRENAAHKLLRILGANGGYLGFYYTATAIEKDHLSVQVAV